MDSKTAAEMLRQIRDGADIPVASKMLGSVSAPKAELKERCDPYSILTNLAHALFWQQLWLDGLGGMRTKSFTEDWRVPEASEWESIRSSFLAGLDQAIAIAEAEPFKHHMKSDDAAVKTLIQIGIHNAYHIGQINLLKRQHRLRSVGK